MDLIQVKYSTYCIERDILRKSVPNAMMLGGFTCFKELSHAEKYVSSDPKLFIISLEVTQWSETDLYPELRDGAAANAFGYLIGFGTSKNERCVFEDFPY